MKQQERQKIIQLLKEGKVGVMPTDTVYGILGSALKPDTVERIYKLRKRDPQKPMIILISSLDDLNNFNIHLNQKQEDFLKENWPNPLSVILSCPDEKFVYLHRGKKSLAFRMPDDKILLDILKESGPLVAPSANLEGEKIAKNISQAKEYFGNQADFYLDGGDRYSQPSKIVRLSKDGTVTVLRS